MRNVSNPRLPLHSDYDNQGTFQLDLTQNASKEDREAQVINRGKLIIDDPFISIDKANKQNFVTMEDRIVAFEEEIIKRIKVLQTYVKKVEEKLNKNIPLQIPKENE